LADCSPAQIFPVYGCLSGAGGPAQGRTRRSSEPEPTGSAWDKFNTIPGWLRSLTFALFAEALSIIHRKEQYNWSKHRSRMWGEGAQPDQSRDEKLDPHCVYFVRTCGFEFEFHSLGQLQACLDYSSRKIQPTSRIPEKDLPNYGGDHSEVQRWFERLPMKLMGNHRRPEVVAALRSALDDFDQGAANKSLQATAGVRRGSKRAPLSSHRARR